MPKSLISKPDFQQMSFGQFGSRYIINSLELPAGEKYNAIQALEDSEVTLTQLKGQKTLTALPIPAGVTVYGDFQSVTWVSGKFLAYIG